MAKGKKQTASDLMNRYAAETGGLDLAVRTENTPVKKVDPVLESLRRNINRVMLIPLNILSIEENVRRTVDEESPEFISLVDSIRESGIRQNIIVDLQDADESNYKVSVIAGQRRILAGRKAGTRQVAALILKLNDRGKRLAEGLAENLFREDLHCLDQAEAYAALVAEGWSEDQISETFERRRKTILQFLRLARYPEKAKSVIRAHQDVFTTYLLFNKFIAKTWKSEEELLQRLEDAVKGKGITKKSAAPPPPAVNRLVRAVQSFNGLKCKVTGNYETGKIVIDYKNQAALDRIIALFESAD